MNDILKKSYEHYGKIKMGGVYISGAVLYGMFMFIVADVLCRNILGSSITGGYEWVQNYMMPLAIFPALPYAYASGVMPKIDMLTSKFSEKGKKVNEIAIVITEIILFSALAWFSLDYAITGWIDKAAFSAGIEMYSVYQWYFLAPIGLSLIIVECLFQLAFRVTNNEDILAS